VVVWNVDIPYRRRLRELETTSFASQAEMKYRNWIQRELPKKLKHDLWNEVSAPLTYDTCYICTVSQKQESRAVARKPRDAAAVFFGLKFADGII